MESKPGKSMIGKAMCLEEVLAQKCNKPPLVVMLAWFIKIFVKVSTHLSTILITANILDHVEAISGERNGQMRIQKV